MLELTRILEERNKSATLTSINQSKCDEELDIIAFSRNSRVPVAFEWSAVEEEGAAGHD